MKAIFSRKNFFLTWIYFCDKKILFQLSESQLVSLLQEVSERTQKKTTVKVTNQFYIPHFLIVYTLRPVHIIIILHTVRYTFPKVLTWRICLIIKCSFTQAQCFWSWQSFPLVLCP